MKLKILGGVFFKQKYVLSIICVFFSIVLNAQQASGLFHNIISNTSEKETDFPVVASDKSAATIRYDEADWKGVIRAITDLQTDINSVTGVKPQLLSSGAFSEYEIIVGTIGKSKLIDQLVASNKLDVSDVK